MRPARRAACAVLTLGVLGGCAGVRPTGMSTVRGDDVAVYRGRATASDGRSGRFELALFLARPDRIHAEISGPVGGPRWIVDGGGGRLAVASVAERVAFVGTGSREGIRAALGIAVDPPDLVAAVLDGAAPEGSSSFAREPPESGRWPPRMALEVDGVTVVLELRRTRGLPPGASEPLGRGTAPPGLRVEPIERLTGTGEPLWETAGGDS